MAHNSRILLVTFAVQGHVSPMLHLARRFHARGFDVTVAAPDFVHRRLNASGGDPVLADSEWARDGLNVRPAAIDGAMESSMPAEMERLLMDSRERVAFVVEDLVASWAIPVTQRCGVPVAGFWPAMLATYRIISAIPELIRRGFISEISSPLQHEPPSSSDDQAAEELSLAGPAQQLSTNDLPWLVGSSASEESRL